jgi:hypothetical protein
MKGHDRDGRNERRGRTGEAKKSEPLISKLTKSSAPNVHSQTPTNQHARWRPSARCSQKISRPVADTGQEQFCLVTPPLLSKKEEHDHHRCADPGSRYFVGSFQTCSPSAGRARQSSRARGIFVLDGRRSADRTRHGGVTSKLTRFRCVTISLEILTQKL